MSNNTINVLYQSQLFEGIFKKDADGHFNSTAANSLAKLNIHPLREIVVGNKVF